MTDASPNFRIGVRFDGDAEDTPYRLHDFLEENEAVPELCNAVVQLQPGDVLHFGNGIGRVTVTRPVVSPPRYTRVRVPIDLKECRGSSHATATIDRKRLTISFRPLRKRTVVELSLTELAERYLAKQVRLNVLAKTKARRKRR